MLALKELGVSFAIDDFGTGYSSLSYLKRFPIDILKVDKSFVDDVMEDSALAEAIVRLGQTMHLQTVAEGIEQAGQLEALRAFGCEFGQGFYLARPLPIAEVSDFLSRMSPGTPPRSMTAIVATREPSDERPRCCHPTAMQTSTRTGATAGVRTPTSAGTPDGAISSGCGPPTP